ncbi:hypothetical protein GQ600_9936 [Phytophthora cactorum]|nr:hypothetical protein GQ600_9936 [Phytophthora cactorum]
MHLFIWLRSCPMLESTNAEQFRKSVQAFARSIVRIELRISVEEHYCSACKAPLVDLIPLPIPERARKDPMSGLYSSRAKARVVEPTLRRCAICNTNFSSQHILRDVLLKSRPAHWPRWEGALTYIGCCDTLQSVINTTDEREKIIDSVRAERDLKKEDGLTALDIASLLHQANDTQMHFCKSEDDPFQNDYLTRLLEMLPPYSSDNRMSRASMDYMVSVLQSRVTADASCCRYSFPRERIEATTFTSSGVQLKRQLHMSLSTGIIM